MNTTSDYQRLVGQVTEYLKNWDKLIIVICGEVKDSLKKDFEGFLSSKAGLTLFDRDIRLIYK